MALAYPMPSVSLCTHPQSCTSVVGGVDGPADGVDCWTDAALLDDAADVETERNVRGAGDTAGAVDAAGVRAGAAAGAFAGAGA